MTRLYPDIDDIISTLDRIIHLGENITKILDTARPLSPEEISQFRAYAANQKDAPK